ncbi:VOC family protein [Terracoccus luteus]|jgi:PhnB protein|uniref:PhnB protein n=1 Tax=Terracoccus luteus TaxID=53356 RepID=A0A495Y1F3_9MICO|nr:VOC family protein [Terracoccus luteus]MBB2986492.1 PhnB protein [Terracoccus luteus]MCP2171919.1 PhnB protein [Terracoccus luteus]RKT79255.1 PhnB protein [Terracoccus luteus]
MPSTLNPYLNFTDSARAAMEFYRGILGGELSISTFGEFGTPPEGASADGVMHAQLETPAGYTLMASDAPPGMPLDEGSSMSISLSGDDADELRGYFEKLADGGTVTVPLERQMWGDEFGMVTDRFGVGWLVNIAGSQPPDGSDSADGAEAAGTP